MPAATNASTCARIVLSSKLLANVFHDAQPIGARGTAIWLVVTAASATAHRVTAHTQPRAKWHIEDRMMLMTLVPRVASPTRPGHERARWTTHPQRGVASIRP